MKTLPKALPMIGGVLYEGPSELDGSPIMAILTGFRKSKNAKTGAMLQSWIMRADMHPREATLSGCDSSICGDCKHRRNTGGKCYVVIEQAPLQVYKAWKRGRYENWTGSFPNNQLADRSVRLGSYGDPAAVPFNVWRRVFSQGLAGWTGYTHQWRDTRFQRYRNIIMASVDTLQEAAEARKAGWRYFRVGEEEIDSSTEVACPASNESGNLTNCVRCNLCSGQRSSAKDVVIQPHGYLVNAYRKKS